jgi:hypothetical protein
VHLDRDQYLWHGARLAGQSQRKGIDFTTLIAIHVHRSSAKFERFPLNSSMRYRQGLPAPLASHSVIGQHFLIG